MKLISYLSNLLYEEDSDRVEVINQIIGIVPNLISQEKNEALIRPITKEVFESIINDIINKKGPSQDDSIVEFYKASWSFWGMGSLN